MITDGYRAFELNYEVTASICGHAMSKLHEMFNVPVRLVEMTPSPTSGHTAECKLLFTADIDAADILPSQRHEYENCIKILKSENQQLHLELELLRESVNNVHIAGVNV